MPHSEKRRNRSAWLAAAARTLTAGRLVAVAPFLWLLSEVAEQPSLQSRAALAALFAAIALSDFVDGRLARLAGAASPHWARIDVVADILLNASALSVAAAFGLVGWWVPAGVVVLGGRFLLRVARQPVPSAGNHLPENRSGKIAGVAFYVLVGWVVVELASGTVAGRQALARGADAVFLYTLVALWLGRAAPMSSRVRRTNRSA